MSRGRIEDNKKRPAGRREDACNDKMILNADVKLGKISKHIYGHFAEHLGRCIYGGIWVGEDSEIPNTGGIRNDVIDALRQIKIPVLRWPGGCFADEYHWQDGIGPQEQRPRMINTHWGGVWKTTISVPTSSCCCAS